MIRYFRVLPCSLASVVQPRLCGLGLFSFTLPQTEFNSLYLSYAKVECVLATNDGMLAGRGCFNLAVFRDRWLLQRFRLLFLRVVSPHLLRPSSKMT